MVREASTLVNTTSLPHSVTVWLERRTCQASSLPRHLGWTLQICPSTPPITPPKSTLLSHTPYSHKTILLCNTFCFFSYNHSLSEDLKFTNNSTMNQQPNTNAGAGAGSTGQQDYLDKGECCFLKLWFRPLVLLLSCHFPTSIL